MPWHTWFVFDLGNVVINVDYEKLIHGICSNADVDRDRLIQIIEGAGGYRDLEKGLVSFKDFHEFLGDRAGYRGDLQQFRTLWSDFLGAPVEGIEEVLDRAREKYRVAFLSNSNEVHAELIPKRYSMLFRKDDRFIFSYRYHCAKPDLLIYQRALEILGAMSSQVLYTDDLVDNVLAARDVGIRAFHFRGAFELIEELEREELI